MTEPTMTQTKADALALAPDASMSMLYSADEAVRRLEEFRAFIKKVMVPGEDFGTIPGAGDRQVLMKSGAEKLGEIYGLHPQFEIVEKEQDYGRGEGPPFFAYVIRCRLFRGSVQVSEGLGSCNSMEKKYRWRWVWPRDVPAGLDPTRLVKSRKGMLRIPNDEGADLANTILKMSKKRAYVDGVITATRSSNIFTQDIEDKEDADGTETVTKREPGDVPDAEFEEAPVERPAFMSEVEFDEVCAKWKTLDEPSQRVQWARFNPRQKELWKERQAQAKRNADKMKATEPLPTGWGGDAPAQTATTREPAREPGED